MSRLQQALQFLKMGISIVPLFHRNKKVAASLIGGTWEQYTTSNNTEYEVRQWLGSGWNNFGVVCGWQNLVVIDFDNIAYYDLWQLWAASQGIDTQYVVASSFKVRTSRGMHVYITTSAPIDNDKRIAKKGGIDIQAQRKYVVGPGCVHASGHVYEPIGDMNFPCVNGIESILPLDLFPAVVAEAETGSMEPVSITTTEYQLDPFATVGMDLITKVKRAVRIESFFPDAQRSSTDGRWLKDWCQFHNDKSNGHSESFWIDTRRQLCGCQTCGMKPMDVLNLYARMHNITESAAVTMMARAVGVWR